jgi:hypothetical protein
MVRLNDDLLSLKPFEDGEMYREVTPENYVEGPFMLKRNGKYYFMWSEGNWTGPNYAVAYAIADSPMGPFNRIGTILQQDSLVAKGAGHHSVIQVPGKDEYYMVYHRRPLDKKAASEREVCIDKMEFDEESNTLSKTGDTEMLIADSVIFAIGQSVEDSVVHGVPGIVVSDKGVIEVDSQMMAGAKGVFAGGYGHICGYLCGKRDRYQGRFLGKARSRHGKSLFPIV